MNETDLEMILAWRNHLDVRRFMFSQKIINIDEHYRWFERTSVDKNCQLLIFEVDKQPLGFINIREIAAGGIANWGFYAAPDAPRGTGSALGNAVLEHAFQILCLHKLCAQVIAHNQRSIHFHMRLGFLKEGVMKQQHFDGKKYHDVWCFGLLSDVWRHNR